jgi:hypothetical protein
MNDPPARDVLLEARLAKRKRCDRGQQRRLFGARQELRSVDEAMGQPRRQLEKLALAWIGESAAVPRRPADAAARSAVRCGCPIKRDYHMNTTCLRAPSGRSTLCCLRTPFQSATTV